MYKMSNKKGDVMTKEKITNIKKQISELFVTEYADCNFKTWKTCVNIRTFTICSFNENLSVNKILSIIYQKISQELDVDLNYIKKLKNTNSSTSSTSTFQIIYEIKELKMLFEKELDVILFNEVNNMNNTTVEYNVRMMMERYNYKYERKTK